MASLGMSYRLSNNHGNIILDSSSTIQFAKLTSVIHMDKFHPEGSLAGSQVGTMITVLKKREASRTGQEICRGYRRGCGEKRTGVDRVSQVMGTLQQRMWGH